MGKSEVISHILSRHNEISVPYDPTVATRASFYKTLGRLLFTQYKEDTFYKFVAPWRNQFDQIKVCNMSNYYLFLIDAC